MRKNVRSLVVSRSGEAEIKMLAFTSGYRERLVIILVSSALPEIPNFT